MEETLFDITGSPIAYIAYTDEMTIYLWDGRPAAYLFNDAIFGFNGLHLGWYTDGVVRDLDGKVAGFNILAADVYTKYEPYKSYKKYRPYRRYRQFVGYKPYFSIYKSSKPLLLLLTEGIV